MGYERIEDEMRLDGNCGEEYDGLRMVKMEVVMAMVVVIVGAYP